MFRNRLRPFLMKKCVSVVKSMSMALVVAWCVAGAGRLGAEGEEAPKGRVPQELIDKVKKVLEKHAPTGKVHVNLGIPIEKQFRFTDRCQKYHDHNVKFGGHIPHESREREQPSPEGFDLTLTWWAESGENGQTGTSLYGHIFPGEYYLRYFNAYKMPENQGYVHLNFDFGPRVNPEILTAVRAELEALGKPVREEVPDPWEKDSAKLQTELTEIVKALQPMAQWRRDGRNLVCEFNTMTFDIHAVDDQGIVAPVHHQEVGPDWNGFIIRLSPIKSALRRQPRPVYGRSYGPYWQHYFVVYDNYEKHMRLDILYGIRTDKKLLEEVTDSVEKMFGKPERF